MFDPGAGRVDLEVQEGATLSEIVTIAMPGLPEAARRRVRVALVTDQGVQIVDPAIWHIARPRPGVRVVLRLAPGDGAMKSVLQIVVAVAAVALGAYFGPMLAGTFGLGAEAWGALIMMGTTAVGNLLINSMFPPPEPDKVRNRYQISGFRNEMRPDGAVPEIMGTIRYAPPFAGSSWSEIVGDIQYIRAAFLFGGGNVELSDIRLGDTSIDEFDEIETETHTDLPANTSLGLYPWQVVEERVGAELERPWPTDDAGERIDGPSIETPVVRSTGKDAAAASVIFWFPAGLIRYNREGDKKEYRVSVRIAQRLTSSDPWQEVTTLTFRAKKQESFFRQYTWDLPTRGRWQVQVTLMDSPGPNERYIKRLVWAALQTVRPENPIAYDGKVTKVGFRGRATAQFNGQIDNFNALCSRICPDWDHETGEWVERATSNPASYYRLALQSEANPKPSADEDIDLEELQDWHDFCRLKDLKFDHVFEDESMTLRDVLTVIAAAGRAMPRRMGGKWGVVIDRPQSLIVDHINPRNADELSTTRSYFEPPHGFRVKFRDATDDYNEAERLVRWPGYDGPINLTEVLEMPGKTDPAEIAREATRRAYELIHRPDVHQATQDHGVRTATRGDLVMFSNYLLTEHQYVGRVRAVEGEIVVLDELVSMLEGETYAMRFRHFPEPAPGEDQDTVGQSVLRLVRTVPGETGTLLLVGSGVTPQEGDLVHFGPAAADSYPVVIQGVEAGEEFTSVVRMVAHAPIIDELTDAYVAPPWTGRIGDEVEYVGPAPGSPKWVSIRSGLEIFESLASGEDTGPREITVQLAPGEGSALLKSYRIEHRYEGPNGWSSVTVPVAQGAGLIEGYVVGDQVELRAVAIAVGDTESAYSPVVTITVGQDDPALPDDLDAQAITASSGLGSATITMAVPSGATTGMQLFRVPAGGMLDTEMHAVGDPVPVTAGSTISLMDGDATRQTIIANGQFSDASAWVAGTGWTIESGYAAASATPLTETVLSQSIAVSAGQVLRLAYRISDRQSGTVTARLTGGAVVSAAEVNANGRHYAELTVTAGTTHLEFLKSGDFEGHLDDVTLYLRTSACAPQGAWDYYAQPRNDEALAGIAGPATAEIA
ncbi:host specificity protein J [Salipiger abyssi]|uniref:Phage tail fiber protein n=1 Tax=Salipiger abyssi TaxID=1250539 RepID=A0A1P8UXJ2_9RHOB|nr:hypothetical protein [Salipiger abyssi]ALF02095.1 tail component [Pelagibaca phage vB_PeaS-P1]APZ54110.1 Phage tail fiber protein [Salipiger abyssi]